jgi:hypothetical protein
VKTRTAWMMRNKLNDYYLRNIEEQRMKLTQIFLLPDLLTEMKK